MSNEPDAPARIAPSADAAAWLAHASTIIDCSVDAIVSKSLDGIIRSWNPGAERMFGYTAEEMIGGRMAPLIPPERLNEEFETLEQVKRGVRIEDFETVRLRKDGTPVFVSLTISAMRDAEGRILGASKIFRDISRRKRAEEALRRKDESLISALDAASAGTYRHDFRTNACECDDALARLFALPAGILPMETLLMRVHSEDREAFMQTARRCQTQGSDFALEYRIVRPDGQVRWIGNKGRLFCDEHDRPAYITGACVDITERKTAEEEATRLKEWLEAELHGMLRLQELSTRLVTQGDLATLLRSIIEAAIELTHADKGVIQLLDATSQTLHIAAHSGFDEPFLSFFKAVRSPQGSVSGTALSRRERVVVEDIKRSSVFQSTPALGVLLKANVRAVQATPLVTRAGAMIGMLSTHYGTPRRLSAREERMLDLLARLAADFIERTQAEDALREADRRKDQFLSMLAHELRNPLAPIVSAVEVLKLGGAGTPSKVEWATEVIGRQAAHLARLLDDLLDIARIRTGRIRLRRGAVELGTLAQRCAEALRPRFEAQGLKLHVAIPAEPVPVHADAARLTQVLDNLLDNALKYTDRDGEVWLTVAREGAEAALRVRDTGVGIEPGELPHIFELFTQVDPSLDRSKGGLGLGLNLVHRIVQKHGGSVQARSDGPGQGSEFIVRIPLANKAARQAPASSAPGAVCEARRIVIIEDNADAAETLAALLHGLGHEASVAHDGRSGLALVERERPDLVLLDIGLPDMDGYQVAERLRQSFPREAVRLIAVSGYGQDEHLTRSQMSGFDAHLLKPVGLAELERVLCEAAAGSGPPIEGARPELQLSTH